MLTLTSKIRFKTLKFKPENINAKPKPRNPNVKTITLTPKSKP